MAKQKKLNSNDINKNSSAQISHSINKIKENEIKYTIILVIIFMIVFALAGYVSLTVSNNYINDSDIYNYSLIFSSKEFTLTNKNVLNDEEGLKSKAISYSIQNNSKNIKKYHIVLKNDDLIKEKCGCTDKVDYKLIKYSIDGVHVNNLTEEMIVLDDEVGAESIKEGTIKFWLSEEANFSDTNHFHGKLVIEGLE